MKFQLLSKSSKLGRATLVETSNSPDVSVNSTKDSPSSVNTKSAYTPLPAAKINLEI